MRHDLHPHRDETTPYAFSIQAQLDGPTGPEATVTDLNLGRSHVVQADYRAILLYLLARQHERDAKAGANIPERDRGWCSNDSVMTGIWGRSCSRENTLHVLLHRLRTELVEAGLDPWFIEKRRGYMRARVVMASVG